MADQDRFLSLEEDWSDFGSQSLGGSLRSHTECSRKQFAHPDAADESEAAAGAELDPKPKFTRPKAGQAPETKGDKRYRKNRNMTEGRAPRCVRCIIHHKSCNGQKPTCGLCASTKNGPAECVWPEGDPTREELSRMLQNRAEDVDEAMTGEEDDGIRESSKVDASKEKKPTNTKKPTKTVGGKVIEDIDPEELGMTEEEFEEMVAKLPKGIDYSEIDFKLAKQIAEEAVASRPLHTEGMFVGLPDCSDFEEQPLPPGEEGERVWKIIKEGFVDGLADGLPDWDNLDLEDVEDLEEPEVAEMD